MTLGQSSENDPGQSGEESIVKALREGEGIEDDLGNTLARMTLGSQVRIVWGPLW
jgi:hypothetical protein